MDKDPREAAWESALMSGECEPAEHLAFLAGWAAAVRSAGEPKAWAILNPKMCRPIIYAREVSARDAATMDGDCIVPLYALSRLASEPTR